MKKDLIIPVDWIYGLLVIGFVFGFFNILFDLSGLGITLELTKVFIFIGITTSFIASVIMIIDIFSNDVNGKYLWTLAILLSTGLFGFFYLRGRDKYVKIER